VALTDLPTDVENRRPSSGGGLAPPLSPRVLVLLAAPIVAMSAWWLLHKTYGYYLDLQVYRLGIEAWSRGGDIYGALPPTSVGAYLPFIYPPFAAVVLGLFAILPWELATVGLLLVSLAALTVTLYVVARRCWPGGGRSGAMALTAFALPVSLLLEPVQETFRLGQVNLILMALVAADCLVERTRWPRGLLIGIAAAVKLTPAVFILYFLLRRDTRAAVVAVVTAVAATALGFLINASASVQYWFGGLGGASGLSGSPFHKNQALLPALVRLQVPTPLRTLLWLALCVVVLALAVPVIRRADAEIALLAVAAVALLVSPTSWSHHWVWAAPALLILAVHAVRRRSAWWAFAAVVAGVAFYLAPHTDLPAEANRELAWTPLQQLIGNTYVLLALAGLVALRLSVRKLGTEKTTQRLVPSRTR
jgi:alpha-1,2-mannosyltransferase